MTDQPHEPRYKNKAMKCHSQLMQSVLALACAQDQVYFQWYIHTMKPFVKKVNKNNCVRGVYQLLWCVAYISHIMVAEILF